MPAPTTGILDNFNRADEDPLSGGGNWLGPIINNVVGDQLRLVSNQVQAKTGTNNKDSYWAAATFNADQEAYAVITDLPTLAGNPLSVYCRITDPSNPTTADCYRFGIGFADIALTEYTNGTQTTIVSAVYPLFGVALLPLLHATGGGFSPEVGMTGWLHCQGTTITCWLGFSPDFFQIFQVTDSAHNNAGFVGLGCRSQSPKWDDFGGGNL